MLEGNVDGHCREIGVWVDATRRQANSYLSGEFISLKELQRVIIEGHKEDCVKAYAYKSIHICSPHLYTGQSPVVLMLAINN